MDKKPYPFPSSAAAQAQAANPFNYNDSPFAIELERLDPFDDTTQNDATGLLALVIEARKNLLEEAKVMRKLLRHDEFTVGPDAPNSKTTIAANRKASKSSNAKKKRIRNVDDDDMPEIDEGNVVESDAAAVSTTNPESEANKVDDDATDEEEGVEEDFEEDNDYMDSYFDNGEEFID